MLNVLDYDLTETEYEVPVKNNSATLSFSGNELEYMFLCLAQSSYDRVQQSSFQHFGRQVNIDDESVMKMYYKLKALTGSIW